VNPPPLELSLEVRAQLGPPVEIGQVGRGRRRIVPILGGSCEGCEHFRGLLTGRVLPGGADWQFIHEDGLTEADARYTLETDRGDLVYVRNRGLRHARPEIMTQLLNGQAVDPSLVYFYSTPTFETAAPALQPLMRAIFVGVGERYPSEVVVRFWKVG
jgi:Protein of unknown function (DUF3237)